MITNGQVTTADNVHSYDCAKPSNVWTLTDKHTDDCDSIGKKEINDVGVVIALPTSVLN